MVLGISFHLVLLWMNMQLVQAETLESLFPRVLQTTQTVNIEKERFTQIEEQWAQARGGLLPSVRFEAAYMKQDAGIGGSAFFQQEQTTLRFAGRQPIFQGMKEWGTLNATRSFLEAGSQSEENSKRLVYVELAGIFYEILKLEWETKALTDLLDSTAKRVAELKRRQKIGRSRLAEVLSAETQAQSLQAQQASLLSQASSMRDNLSSMTGLDKNIPLNEQVEVPNNLPPLSSYLSCIENRSDLKALKHKSEGYEHQIWVARGGHLPTVDFAGNYYIKRPGILSSVGWDVTLSLSLPIIQGGIVDSQVAEAASLSRQTFLEEQEQGRKARVEVSGVYENLKSLVEQTQILDRLVGTAQQNYNLLNKEYGMGLVSNLEVLQAVTSLLEAKRSYGQALFNKKKEFVHLEALVQKGVPNAN